MFEGSPTSIAEAGVATLGRGRHSPRFPDQRNRQQTHGIIGQLRDHSHADRTTVVNGAHSLQRRTATVDDGVGATANQCQSALLGPHRASAYRAIKNFYPFRAQLFSQRLAIGWRKRAHQDQDAAGT